MNRVEKHKTNKSGRKRMTVQAFCNCPQAYDCIQDCGMDEVRLYIVLENYAHAAVTNYYS